jgi:ribosome maturation factor RimP
MNTMKLTPLEHKITEIAAPVADDLGLALVQIKLVGEGDGQTVQILAENPQTRNLGVDDCAKLSRALSAVMDVEDPINGAYRLEVSSPGIDRPLTREQDFQTYKGFEIKLETHMPTVNGQKRFRGHIEDIKDSVVTLKIDAGKLSDGLVEIPFNDIAKAKLILTDHLIKQTANL